MLFSLPALLGFAAVSGLASHIFYWRKYEFDAAVLDIAFKAGIATAGSACITASHHGWLYAIRSTFLLEATYLFTLAFSISTYRLFLHPLRHHSGPFWARLSMFWKVSAVARRGPHFQVIDDLHQKYGDIVRVGPNHLSINSLEALMTIYGRQSPCTKPPSYLIGGIRSLQSERDPHRHSKRRAIWDKALGSQASNAFFPKLESIADLLVEKLILQQGRSLTANDWMHYFTFDVMGAFALGRTYGQLQATTLHEGVKVAGDYLKYAIYGVQVPWLAYLLTQVPFLPDPQVVMMQFSRKSLDERVRQNPSVPDAMSHILSYNSDPKTTELLSKHDIESDVFLIQIAGSDTSYSVLMDLMFWIAARPEYQDRIRRETESAFNLMGNGTGLDWPTLAAASFLDALIRETMRFHPPVSSGLGRCTPAAIGLEIPAGMSSDQTLHIPPNVVVSVPTYSLHHDSRYFVEPNSFIPERWSTQPELVIDGRAFCPFSIGSYGCAGKYFAYMEIKILLAKLLHHFEIRFGTEGFDAAAQKAWLRGHQDHMTLQAPELKLRFLPRIRRDQEGGF